MKKETYFVRKHNNCSAFDSGGTRKKYSPLECNCGASLYNDAYAQGKADALSRLPWYKRIFITHQRLNEK